MKNATQLPRRTFLGAGAALVAGLTPAFAQDVFPSRPVRLVVPYTPGGSNDVIARLLGQHLSVSWSQPVIVDNKAGAAGNIGSDFVAKAPADGYTLLITNNNTMSINPVLFPKLPFDAEKDFEQVTLLGTVPVLLVVNPNLKVTTVKELIALAKSQPGRLSYASSGVGSPQHMAAELFKSMTATHILNIPYKGAASAVTDLLGGQVDMQFGAINSLLPHVRSGRLRAIGVAGARRADLLPDVPTIAEAGVPGFETDIWLGLAAPAKTPRPVIEKINREVRRILALPDVRDKLAEQGIYAQTSSPADMAALAAVDRKRWDHVIKNAGLKPE